MKSYLYILPIFNGLTFFHGLCTHVSKCLSQNISFPKRWMGIQRGELKF